MILLKHLPFLSWLVGGFCTLVGGWNGHGLQHPPLLPSFPLVLKLSLRGRHDFLTRSCLAPPYVNLPIPSDLFLTFGLYSLFWLFLVEHYDFSPTYLLRAKGYIPQPNFGPLPVINRRDRHYTAYDSFRGGFPLFSPPSTILLMT